MRKSTPNNDLSHESFTAGENQENCCRNKIVFRKQELFFKTFFAILRNTGFCLQHMQAKKRKHIGNNEETVTLNI